MSVHCTTAESPLSLGSTEEIKQVQQRSKLTNFWNSHSRLSRGQTWRVFSQREIKQVHTQNFMSVHCIVLKWRKSPDYIVFSTSTFCDSRDVEKVECGCTIKNLPVSNGTKIISILQQFHVKVAFTFTLWFECVMDKETLNVFVHQRCAKSKPHQPWHSDRAGPYGHYCTPETC